MCLSILEKKFPERFGVLPAIVTVLVAYPILVPWGYWMRWTGRWS